MKNNLKHCIIQIIQCFLFCGGAAWKSSNGWKIEKDTANHGGRVWKLFNKAGKRIASLGADGSVLAD